MKMDPRCFRCLLSRVEFESRLVTRDEGKVAEVVEACRDRLEECRGLEVPAPRIATSIHRTAYQLLGHEDPYHRLKEQNTRMALEVCRTMRPRLASFRDRVLASIIGNTLDYAVENHAVAEDFLPFFRRELSRGLWVDDTEEILRRADRTVYLTDNCGEIVFDRLVLEALAEREAKVTLAVKGEPILNDATLREARQLGLDRLVDCLTTTGSGDVGISLEKIPPDLSAALDQCTLVIAKGMANYESLSEEEGLPPVAYLMAVKCDPIAESVGVPRGSYIARFIP